MVRLFAFASAEERLQISLSCLHHLARLLVPRGLVWWPVRPQRRAVRGWCASACEQATLHGPALLGMGPHATLAASAVSAASITTPCAACGFVQSVAHHPAAREVDARPVHMQKHTSFCQCRVGVEGASHRTATRSPVSWGKPRHCTTWQTTSRTRVLAVTSNATAAERAAASTTSSVKKGGEKRREKRPAAVSMHRAHASQRISAQVHTRRAPLNAKPSCERFALTYSAPFFSLRPDAGQRSKALCAPSATAVTVCLQQVPVVCHQPRALTPPWRPPLCHFSLDIFTWRAYRVGGWYQGRGRRSLSLLRRDQTRDLPVWAWYATPDKVDTHLYARSSVTIVARRDWHFNSPLRSTRWIWK